MNKDMEESQFVRGDIVVYDRDDENDIANDGLWVVVGDCNDEAADVPCARVLGDGTIQVARLDWAFLEPEDAKIVMIGLRHRQIDALPMASQALLWRRDSDFKQLMNGDNK